MPEDKVKSFGLIELPEAISKQPSIYSVVWPLMVILMQRYNEKQQTEQGEI